MLQLSASRPATSRVRSSTVERLEGRCLLAAHVIGSPLVYSTIQAAVNAAPIGGTVQVDAGIYHDLVNVNKSLTLRGAAGGQSIVDGQLIGANRSSAFFITANDVTIDGFTVQGQNSSVDGAGIVIAPSIAGTQIVNNTIQNNSVGLYLANSSSTDPAVIRHNIFAYNNNVGNNFGRGIYSDGTVSGGLLTNVQIDANLFIGNIGDTTGGNAEAAIGLEAQIAPQTNISITSNVMVGNGKGVLMSSLSGALIANNYIAGCADINSAAIRAEGGVNDVAITGNTIVSNPAAGIRLDSKINGLPNSGFAITNNNIAGNAAAGLSVTAGTYNGVLDARKNFWGSPTGPSGAGPGAGDAILPGDANVLFDPWTSKPSETKVDKGVPTLQNSSLLDNNGDLAPKGTATLSAGVYVINDLKLSGNSALTITGPTTIYVTGKVDISGGSQLLTASGKAADLVLHVIGTGPVSVSGGAILYGRIDAPISNVNLNGGSKFFGSILDDLNLNINGGSSIFVIP